MPQLTAIAGAVRGVAGTGVPLIADGGIRYSGDAVKALAAGASTVMLGGLLAGLDESPGERILYQGRSFKRYRGMGSLGAMEQGSADRYRQGPGSTDKSGDDGSAGGTRKLVPEGVEGRVPYRGPLAPLLLSDGGGPAGGDGVPGLRHGRRTTDEATIPAGLGGERSGKPSA